MLSKPEIEDFRRELLRWFTFHQRDLPWRRTRDPYRIWISEIMLQQTRVAAVIPFYERFLQRFPDLETLASAPEQDLLASWAGLGYYYRAHNLQKAAQRMRDAGGFPATYEGIRQLPGIGDYTAAAIASISLELPHPVMDGNVLRVLSRVFDDATNIASAGGRRHFITLAHLLLERDHPASFNQAVMELGATICVPKNPQCLVCPIGGLCRARQKGNQASRPVKIVAKKTAQEKRTLFWIERPESILLWQRPRESRLMPGFWELPEYSELPGVTATRSIGTFRHGITFHHYLFEVARAFEPPDTGACKWIPWKDLETFPLSTVFRKAMKLVAGKAHDPKRPAKLTTAAVSGHPGYENCR